MDRFLTTLVNTGNSINEWVGQKVAWLTTVLVLIVCIDVLVRYFFNFSVAWIMELEWHVFALIFLLGAGYAFKHDRHVRVDLFYTRFSERDKARVNFWGGLLFLVPWCILIIYTAFFFAMESLRVREASPNPDGLPAQYLIKFAIVAGMCLLLIQGIVSIAESWLTLRNGRHSTE